MKTKLGVYIGRFNPIHLGHEAVIDQMIEDFQYKSSLILVGSASAQQSLRHFFTYAERKEMITKLYPDINIAPLPDFVSDEDWWDAIGDITQLMGVGKHECTFYSGCKEDVQVLSKFTKHIVIVNRFDGTTPMVSATEVRDALIHKRDLIAMVNVQLHADLERMFDRKWKQFEAQ